MAYCSNCGAVIAENSKFCNSCGAMQEVPPVQTSEAESVLPTEAESALQPKAVSQQDVKRPSVKKLVIAISAFVIVIAICLGVSAHLRAKAEQLRKAKVAASEVLGKIEACQAAVTVGVSLDALSEKAGAAQQAVLEFSRSEHASILPKFTPAATLATQDYVDSCSAWFEDNKRASEEWDKAYEKWQPLSGKSAPDIDDYKDDTRTQSLWQKADKDLTAAQAILK